MISAVKGTVFSIEPGRVGLLTSAGLIIQVHVSLSSYSALQQAHEIVLHTVLKIKDEDVFLYGFLTTTEKKLFEKLITVSGIGGKTALSLLSRFSASECAAAIIAHDVDLLSSVPGIGKKTAQRLILELTGKLDVDPEQPSPHSQLRDDVVSGLINLGYHARHVRDAVNAAMKDHPELAQFEELFKFVLRTLTKS